VARGRPSWAARWCRCHEDQGSDPRPSRRPRVPRCPPRR
jgi:hypothetical protein